MLTKDLEELIKQLQNLNNVEEFDDIQLLDMLWLSLSMDEQEKVISQKDKKDFLQWLKTWLKSLIPNKKEKDLPPDTHHKRQSGTTTVTSTGIPLTIDSSSSDKMTIKLPKKKEYFVTDELIKSLSDLKKSFASSASSDIVDEEATVEYIAKTGIFKPHFKSKSENYYDLYLMIDVSESMQIWEDSLNIFVDKLRSFSIFKSIKVLYMDTSKKDVVFYKNKALTHEVSGKLNSYDNRKLLFIISDCIGSSWREGNLLYRVYEYNQYIPTSLINMLPTRMWNGTILANTNKTELHVAREYKGNHLVKSKLDSYLSSIDTEYFNSDILRLPVVTFDSESFKSLSSFIVCKKDNLCSGVIANKEEINYKDDENSKDLTAEEIVIQFLKNSSPLANQLALYFSVTTHLNFPIMKMIQHNMLTKSRQIHLAEVFVGGLLDKSKKGSFYTFIVDKDGNSVRDILLDRLGSYKAISTLHKNSKFIAQNLGSSLDFSAIINGNFDSDDFSDADKVFATMAYAVLKKAGGRYAKIATNLKKEEIEEDEVTFITPTSKRFQMGSKDGRDNEKPVHEVIINYDFEISPYPVTVGEFRTFVEDTNYKTEAELGDGAYVLDDKGYNNKKDAYWDNPYFEQTDEHPVVCISWNDIQEYITWLNEKTDETYRLPTEAEWEYVCRAGTTTKWSFGDDEKELVKYAWYDEKGGKGTKPVGIKLPNPWGLYDMHGNVWEWCEDDFVDNYEETPRDGKVHVDKKAEYKVLRGGSWDYVAYDARSAFRVRDIPTIRGDNIGFRLLRTLPSDLGDS